MLNRDRRVSPEQLLRIADSVPAVVALYDISTAEYLYVNKAITHVMGYTPEEFVEGGLGFAVSLVHPDDVQELLAKNQEALDLANIRMAENDESIANFEYRTLHKDGRYRWVKTDGTVFGRAEDGSVQLILNVTMDISDQKKTEARLERSLKMLGQALQVEGGMIEERDVEF